MSDDDFKLDEFAPDGGGGGFGGFDGEDKSAGDLAPVFDVPVSISAVLGR